MLDTVLGYLIGALLILGFGIAVVIAILNELEVTRFTTRFTVGLSCVCVGSAFTIAFGWWMVETRTHTLSAFLYLALAALLAGAGFYFLLRK